MTRVTFQQSGTSFVLEDRQLVMSASFAGRQVSRQIWLRDIDPLPRHIRKRLWVPSFLALVIGLLPLLAVKKFGIHSDSDAGLAALVGYWAAIFVFVSAALAIRGVAAYEVRDAEGIPLFEILIVKGKRLAAEEFVQTLGERIATLRQFDEPPNQSTDPTSPSGTPPAGQESRHP
jgi:hypothetical protein